MREEARFEHREAVWSVLFVCKQCGLGRLTVILGHSLGSLKVQDGGKVFVVLDCYASHLLDDSGYVSYIGGIPDGVGVHTDDPVVRWCHNGGGEDIDC